MEVLLETLLRLIGNFEPITSAQVLAIVGVVSLVFVVGYVITHAGAAAAQGASNVILGLRALALAIAWLAAALLILFLIFGLVSGTLSHVLH